MLQVCHIVLGLKPVSRQEENKIVCGWLQREERRGYLVGQFWCLVAIEWWHAWENYVTSPAKVSGKEIRSAPMPPYSYFIGC